jgi:cholesterol transport system auxiliary component
VRGADRKIRSKKISLGRKGQVALALVLSLQLSACALVKKQEAPRETFEISAPQSFSGLRATTNSQILVKLPTSLDAINSERIIVRPSPRVITYLEGAQWSDTVPKMVQAKLVEAFENSASTGATAKPGDGLVIDFQLVSDIRRFEVLNRQATIEISIKLLSDSSGKVVETRIFEVSATSASGTAESYVNAFDEAFDRLARDIIKWVLSRA